jgi:hypothetical protein
MPERGSSPGVTASAPGMATQSTPGNPGAGNRVGAAAPAAGGAPGGVEGDTPGGIAGAAAGVAGEVPGAVVPVSPSKGWPEDTGMNPGGHGKFDTVGAGTPGWRACGVPGPGRTTG